MANITYPDVDRLTFWGVPYQFDYVFGPGTKQAQVKEMSRYYFLVDEYYYICAYGAMCPMH